MFENLNFGFYFGLLAYEANRWSLNLEESSKFWENWSLKRIIWSYNFLRKLEPDTYNFLEN